MAETQFQQIRRVTVTEQAAEQIRDMILSGQFGPGDKLPSQKELEKLMNVSRPTLREAISRLLSEDVIEARQGQGYYVRQPQLNINIRCPLIRFDSRQLRDLFEARLFFEASLAQLASLFATDEEIHAMQDFLIRFDQGKATQEELAYGGNYIHLMIANASHNAILAGFELSLLDLAQQNHNAFVADEDQLLRTKYQSDPHHRIVNAIAAHDVHAAYAESFEHIINYTSDLTINEKYVKLLDELLNIGKKD